MAQNTNPVTLLHRSIGANGPSMGLGVPLMVIGFVTFIGGLANLFLPATLIGLLLLLLAAYLILSIDCIAIEPLSKELYLYRDYFIFKRTNRYRWTDYSSVCIYYEIDAPRNNRGSLNRTQFKTFEVFMVSENGKKLLMKEFGNIEQAKELQAILTKNTGLKLVGNPIRETKERKK